MKNHELMKNNILESMTEIWKDPDSYRELYCRIMLYDLESK
jgi:hypothetical protein